LIPHDPEGKGSSWHCRNQTNNEFLIVLRTFCIPALRGKICLRLRAYKTVLAFSRLSKASSIGTVPHGMVGDLHDREDSMFENVSYTAASGRPEWAPAVGMTERKDSKMMALDSPGLSIAIRIELLLRPRRYSDPFV